MFEDGEGEFGVDTDAVQGAGLGFLENLMWPGFPGVGLLELSCS